MNARTLVFLFVFSTTISLAQPSNEASVIDVVMTVGEEITHIYSEDGTVLPPRSKSLQNFNGFPGLDCSFDVLWWEYPKNRFLVKSQLDQYYVIDSLFNIVIGGSDTILTVNYHTGKDVDVQCEEMYGRGFRGLIFYEAIRGAWTTVYDYDGHKFIRQSFGGRLVQDSFIPDYPSFVIIADDSTTRMGLIDSTGNMLYPLNEQFILPFRHTYSWNVISRDFWQMSMPDDSLHWNLIHSDDGEVYLQYDAASLELIDYGMFIFGVNGKKGIFHPNFGLLLKPKYDYLRCCLSIPVRIVLGIDGVQKNWKVPRKIINKGMDQF